MTNRVAVIGAGISGLCVAYRLQKTGARVSVFESSDRIGGNIRTERRDGFLIENGPNSLLANVELLELIDELGLSNEILAPFPSAKNRFILRDGKPVKLPDGLLSAISTKAFSASGKLRILKEPFVSSRASDDESVAAFFERRLGGEIARYAVDPFVSGIYAGDAKRLSIKNSFPRLFEMERDHGSLVKAGLFGKREKTKRLPKDTPRTFTFHKGMGTLTDALAGKLDDLRLDTPIGSLDKTANAYVVNGERFNAVALCLPAFAASNVIASLDDDLSRQLNEIQYPPIAVVYTGYKKEQVKFVPNGFGLLVPSSEKRSTLGTLWNSSVFSERSPVGYHLFTTFIGGARDQSAIEKDNDKLISIVADELASTMNIDGEPTFAAVKKHARSIPQYNIGYEKVIGAIENFEQENPGIVFCSNFYKGISVGDCIKNSIAASEKILSEKTEN